MRRIRQRIDFAKLLGTIEPPSGSGLSCFSHTSVSGPYNLCQHRELFLQMPTAFLCDPVRLPAGIRFNCSDPAAFFKTADRAIQRPWAELNAREELDIFHDCVAVLISIGKACENEDGWI
jgi:hypothetical protein